MRAPLARALTPVGAALARAGVRPDAVTLLGTLGVSAGALAFYPSGKFLVGSIVITVFAFSDMLDGALARARGGGSRWGAFLDSSLDRVGDAAIFGGLALYFAGHGNDNRLAAVAMYCLVAGMLTSYVRARAEGLGLRADVGIAERSERLILILTATGLSGLLDYPPLLAGALWLLAAASTVTVFQRFITVHRQVAGDPLPEAPQA
ncbi:MAG: phosphatidylinositol phosphate synthase [Frankiaceae bacterium]